MMRACLGTCQGFECPLAAVVHTRQAMDAEFEERLKALAPQNVTVRNALFLLKRVPEREVDILRVLCIKLADENALLKRRQIASDSTSAAPGVAECRLVEHGYETP